MSTNFIAPFLLIHRDGKAYEYPSLEAMAADKIDSKAISKYHDCENVLNKDGSITQKFNYWIIRDDVGNIVTGQDLRDATEPSFIKYRYRTKIYEDQRHAASLGLPIPHLRSRYRSQYYRHNKCRHLLALRADIKSYRFDIKPKGKKPKPQDPWDDRIRSDIYDRSWKRHRKTQWKG